MKEQIEKILDLDNYDDLVFEENNLSIEYEQLAKVTIEEVTYGIIRPLDPKNEEEEEGAFVLKVIEKDNQLSLEQVTDEALLDQIFDILENSEED